MSKDKKSFLAKIILGSLLVTANNVSADQQFAEGSLGQNGSEITISNDRSRALVMGEQNSGMNVACDPGAANERALNLAAKYGFEAESCSLIKEDTYATGFPYFQTVHCYSEFICRH